MDGMNVQGGWINDLFKPDIYLTLSSFSSFIEEKKTGGYASSHVNS